MSGVIYHDSYFDGKVQILGFHDFDEDATIETCVVEQGEYDFGPAEHTETITCTFNGLIVNGTALSSDSKPFVIRPGDPRKLSAEKMAIYKCITHVEP